MIRHANECAKEQRENMRGGDGVISMTKLVTIEELCGKGRLFSRGTINPGCSIGYHVHENDSEIYYILSGKAVYSDNGTEVEVSAGDVTVCPEGTGHGIKNNSDEPVDFIALIVYA